MGQSSNEINNKKSTPPPRPARTDANVKTLQPPEAPATKTSALPVKTNAAAPKILPVKIPGHESVDHISESVNFSALQKQFGTLSSSPKKEIPASVKKTEGSPSTPKIGSPGFKKAETLSSSPKKDDNQSGAKKPETSSPILKKANDQSSLEARLERDKKLSQVSVNPVESSSSPKKEEDKVSLKPRSENSEKDIIAPAKSTTAELIKKTTFPPMLPLRERAYIPPSNTSPTVETKEKEPQSINGKKFEVSITPQQPLQSTPPLKETIKPMAKTGNIKSKQSNENNNNSKNIVDVTNNFSANEFDEELRFLEGRGDDCEELVHHLEEHIIIKETYAGKKNKDKKDEKLIDGTDKDEKDKYKKVIDDITLIFNEAKSHEQHAEDLRAVYVMMLINEESAENSNVKNGNGELDAYLKAKKININYFNIHANKGFLHEAIFKGKKGSVKTILSNNANPNIRGETNHKVRSKAPLWHIAKKTIDEIDEEIFNFLLDNGASINIDNDMKNAIHDLKMSCKKLKDYNIKCSLMLKKLSDRKKQIKSKIEMIVGSPEQIHPTATLQKETKQLYVQLREFKDSCPKLMEFFESYYDYENDKINILHDFSKNLTLIKGVYNAKALLRGAYRHERRAIDELMELFDKLLVNDKDGFRIRKLVNCIKELGLEISFVDRNGDTLLHRAVTKGNEKAVEILLPNIDHNIMNKRGMSVWGLIFFGENNSSENILSLDKINKDIVWLLLDKTVRTEVEDQKIMDCFKRSFDKSNKNNGVKDFYLAISEKFKEIKKLNFDLYEKVTKNIQEEKSLLYNKVKWTMVDAINQGKNDSKGKEELKNTAGIWVKGIHSNIPKNLHREQISSITADLEKFQRELFGEIDSDGFNKYVDVFYSEEVDKQKKFVLEVRVEIEKLIKDKIVEGAYVKSKSYIKGKIEQRITKGQAVAVSIAHINEKARKDLSEELKNLEKELISWVDQDKFLSRSPSPANLPTVNSNSNNTAVVVQVEDSKVSSPNPKLVPKLSSSANLPTVNSNSNNTAVVVQVEDSKVSPPNPKFGSGTKKTEKDKAGSFLVTAREKGLQMGARVRANSARQLGFLRGSSDKPNDGLDDIVQGTCVSKKSPILQQTEDLFEDQALSSSPKSAN